jgi:hypothetical protein
MKITDFPAHPQNEQTPVKAWYDREQGDGRWYCMFANGDYATYFTRTNYWAPVYTYRPTWLAELFTRLLYACDKHMWLPI